MTSMTAQTPQKHGDLRLTFVWDRAALAVQQNEARVGSLRPPHNRASDQTRTVGDTACEWLTGILPDLSPLSIANSSTACAARRTA